MQDKMGFVQIMGKAITVKGLRKSYGDVEAVKGIDFDVDEGSLFAFLGVNGAGKSTTINILCTLLEADGGEVSVCGLDLAKDAEAIRSKIGVVFQGSALDARLSVRENLSTRASFYGLSGEAKRRRLAELGELLDLGEIMQRPYGKLSGGQRRRVDVARGLINSPRILFLDEPTTGLDPQTRRTVWDIVDRLRRELNMTVFLTTHYMEEADGADKVVIIDEGRIVAVGAPVELKNRYSYDRVKLYAPRSEKIEERLKGMEFQYDGACYDISVDDSGAARKFICENGDILRDFEFVKGNMDDVFLNVTGKKPGGEV